MTEIPPIADERLEVLKKIPTQTLIDGLWVKGWPSTYVEGAKPLQLGQSMAGRAVTLRFVPHRPDIAEDKPKKEQSAEYVAIELCGPSEVLVIDAMGWQYSGHLYIGNGVLLIEKGVSLIQFHRPISIILWDNSLP